MIDIKPVHDEKKPIRTCVVALRPASRCQSSAARPLVPVAALGRVHPLELHAMATDVDSDSGTCFNLSLDRDVHEEGALGPSAGFRFSGATSARASAWPRDGLGGASLSAVVAAPDQGAGRKLRPMQRESDVLRTLAIE